MVGNVYSFSDFFVTALSDIRKIQKCVIFVSHDRSLSRWVAPRGSAKLETMGCWNCS
jgi:hypothetical protein